MRLVDYRSSVGVGTIFRNTVNSKTNEPHKFALNLSQNKSIVLQNLSICYTWKIIRQ